ncbi:MAG TPA: helical backbone metal receptor [Bryobacteraceae bacterium]|nr:helical backbone metal receptor [Bryobacteraceae bacterium]
MKRRLFTLGLLFCVAAWGSIPARIVSTSPSITETLFALGLGNHVVGVTTYDRYPPAVLKLPKIGSFSDPDPEKIAVLRPDLVIIHRSFPRLAERLSAVNIRYTEIDVISLADIYVMISDIGRATGVPDRAGKLNLSIKARLDTVREETAGRKRPSVLMLVGRNPGVLTGMIAIAPGSYLGELIEIAGGRNVLTGTAIAYPHISMETVLRLDPDVILDASYMGDASGDTQKQAEMLRGPWLSHHEIRAVRNGMIFGLPSEALVTPGPRVIDAVETIRNAIRKTAP